MKLSKPSHRAFAILAIILCVQCGASSQTFTTFATFDGANGSFPVGLLAQGTDGNFYGVTESGGSNGKGNLFRLTPAGEITNIYSFCSQANCADGELPTSGPILGSDGNLYGVVQGGGNSNQSGIIYKVTLDGQFTILHTFCSSRPCTDGEAPQGIILGNDGNFYGVTDVGGRTGSGVVFKFNSAGDYHIVYTFCVRLNCSDGGGPFFAPIQGADGSLYGTAYQGGAFYKGTLYWINPSGGYRVLHDFCDDGSISCQDGTGPLSFLEGADGNFYGTTAYGGPFQYGTFFELTTKRQFRVLHNFGEQEGNFLFPLTLASSGNFYGVAAVNKYLVGADAFQLTPAGDYSTIHEFQYSAGTGNSVFQGSDGSLYGTADSSPYGNAFKISNGASPLLETVPTGGKVRQSILILGNNLTGSTSVTFNGVPAKFTVESDTYIKATVPAGATTGTVSVVTSTGTLNSNPQFVVTK